VPRSPLFLAALASAAVPGLDPVSAEGVHSAADASFEVAFVTDRQERRWVVKAPRNQAAGAELEAVGMLGPLLARRLEVAMPVVRGTVAVPEGRAIVYLRLPGRPLDFGAVPSGAIARAMGRALAQIHNLEHAVLEEAGRPTYDAEAHRRRQLSELDRAAATGHVPTNLLTRWEQRLEDISLWRFAPTAVHGSFVGDNVLVSFDDDDDSETGAVRGVLGWEHSRVGDPADDFADLVSRAGPDTIDAVLRAYTQSRVERPDGNLLARARLAAEMTPMQVLLRALGAGAIQVVEQKADELRELERRISMEDERRAVDADLSLGSERPLDSDWAMESDWALEAERTNDEARPTSLARGSPTDAAPPEPDWDATQPHQPFPDTSVTQVIDHGASPGDVPDVESVDAGQAQGHPAGAEPANADTRRADTGTADAAEDR